MKKTTASVTFSEESLQFLKLAGEQTKADWLEENSVQYQRLIRDPLTALADSVKNDLEAQARGYHFPSRALGRIKKPAHKIEPSNMECCKRFRSLCHLSAVGRHSDAWRIADLCPRRQRQDTRRDH